MTSQQTMGICIPTLLIDISKDELYKIVNKYNLGEIEKIYIQKNKHHSGANTGFVWFSKWHTNITSKKMLNTLKEGKGIQLLYDFPNFIQCYQIKNDKFKYGFGVEYNYKYQNSKNIHRNKYSNLYTYSPSNSQSWDLHIGRCDEDKLWRKVKGQK